MYLHSDGRAAGLNCSLVNTRPCAVIHVTSPRFLRGSIADRREISVSFWNVRTINCTVAWTDPSGARYLSTLSQALHHYLTLEEVVRRVSMPPFLTKNNPAVYLRPSSPVDLTFVMWKASSPGHLLPSKIASSRHAAQSLSWPDWHKNQRVEGAR